MTDITLANVTAVLDKFRKLHPNSAYETNIAEYPTDITLCQTVPFSAKNYDILEKNLKEPILTKFKKVAYRCKKMP